MRSIIFLLLIFIFTNCTETKEVASESVKLNGTWVPVQQVFSGKQLPKTVFENQKLIIDGEKYTVFAESADKGVVKKSENKLDIYGEEGPNAGKHFTAIYKLENDLLIICYNLKGDAYPDKFETEGKALYFLSTYKKETGN